DAIEFSLCISPLNDNVLPLYVSKLAQTLPERINAGIGRGTARYPIRGTFFGCCAWANVDETRRTSVTIQSSLLIMAFPSSATVMPQNEPYENRNLWNEDGRESVTFLLHRNTRALTRSEPYLLLSFSSRSPYRFITSPILVISSPRMRIISPSSASSYRPVWDYLSALVASSPFLPAPLFLPLGHLA